MESYTREGKEKSVPKTEDYISRKDAIALVDRPVVPTGDGDYDNAREAERESIKDDLMSLPSTEPRYTGCHGCIHYDQQQTALICRDCKRSYRDMYEEG